MKKLTFMLLLLLGGGAFVFAQNATRNLVVVEIATGTWCTFCPGSALAADELVAKKDKVAIIEHHELGTDPFITPASTARVNYYNSTGFPTAYFNGGDALASGDPSNSMYDDYYPRYVNALAAPTPIDLAMEVEYDLVNDTYLAKAYVTQVGSVPATNIILHATITESHIPFNWLGMSEVNFVNRQMLPSPSGTLLNLTQGQTDTFSYAFQLDPSWVNNNCELVFFVQNSGGKQIYNGAVAKLEAPEYTTDVKLFDFSQSMGASLCVGEPLAPEIIIENRGSTPLTSLEVVYSVNGTNAPAYSWTGNLDFSQEDTIQLPAIAFTPQAGNNDLQVFLVNPNGTTDEAALDNLVNHSFSYATYPNGLYQLVILPDGNGDEITWKVTDENTGAVVYAGGPYAAGSSSMIIQQFPLGTEAGCFRFDLMDSGNDGLIKNPNSYARFYAPQNELVLDLPGGEYGSGVTSQFSVAFNTAIDLIPENLVEIFPNPSEGVFSVRMEEFVGQEAQISVFQPNGQVLQSSNTRTGTQEIDLTGSPVGIYLLKVQVGERILTKKISLK